MALKAMKLGLKCQENTQMPGVYAQKGDSAVLQLYLNKGRESIGTHTHGVFLSRGKAQPPFILNFLALCCPLPHWLRH